MPQQQVFYAKVGDTWGDEVLTEEGWYWGYIPEDEYIIGPFETEEEAQADMEEEGADSDDDEEEWDEDDDEEDWDDDEDEEFEDEE